MEENTMYLLRYDNRTINNIDKNKLIQVVYDNFIDLANFPELDHTHSSVATLFSAPETLVLIAYYDNAIVGYLIARHLMHNMTDYMHIYYIYVAPSFRKCGIATNLLNMIKKCAAGFKIYKVSLTYDSTNKTLENLYRKNKFGPDQSMISSSQHVTVVCNL